MALSYAAFVGLAFLAAAAPAGKSAKQQAQRLLDQGSALYSRGDLEGALDKFRRAYDTYPSAKLWFNIGQVERDRGRAVEAMEAFQRFLAEGAQAAPHAMDEARTAVHELGEQLGHLTVACDATGAQVDLDDGVLGPTPLSLTIWVLPGRHVLTLQSDAGATATPIDVKAGESQTVVLQLEPPAPPALALVATHEAAPAQARPPDLSAAQPPNSGWLGRKWTWVAGGVAIACTAGAITFGVLMQSKYDELNRTCGSASRSQTGCSEDDFHALDLRKNTANVLWGLAGVAAVTAGLLWVVEGRRITVKPAVSAGSVGMAARTSF